MSLLPAGAVTILGPSSGVSVVGAAPQWADGSDATYGEFVVNMANYGTFLAAPLNGTPVAGAVSAQLFVRTEHSASMSGSLVRASVVSPAGRADASGTLVGGNYYLDVPAGTMSETTVPLVPIGGATVETILAGGPCELRFSWASSVTGDVIRIVEAHVIVEVAAGAPYRRTYPVDGAVAGGRRTYPRPKARQSSNRTSGGIL